MAAEPAHKLPEEDQANIHPKFGVVQGGGEGDGKTQGDLQAVRAGEEAGADAAAEQPTERPNLRAINGGGEGDGKPQGDLKEAGKDEDEDEDGLYKADGDRQGFLARLRGRRNDPNRRRGFLRRNRRWALLSAVVSGGVLSLAAFFFFGIFDLPNFMKNVEARGFMRYQVDLNGRSSKWIQAYMELRFSEIDDPHLAPQNRDNLLFRSDKVSTNQPLRDWYRTLRASSFEQDVFESRGIKFTSVAYKDGNIIKFRPGKMIIPNSDRPLTFDPSQKVIDAINKGDVSAFNGELRDFVEVHVYENDKAGRAAIKQLVGEQYPEWWKAVKRFHLRHDIQNMIGVRSWKFFETTRNNLHEKKISIRNKILTEALPEDSKTGAFIKCLFGLSECTASSDPADPKARQYTPTGNQRQGDKTNGDPKNPQPVGDGTGDSTLQAGTDTAAAAGDVVGKIASKIIDKAGLLSLLDSLARFDQSIHNHSLSKLVTQAKSAQVAGLYTVFAVASDQLTTGQLTGEEVNSFMKAFANPTNSEGWTTVVNPASNAGQASADSTSFTPAKNKQEFCSAKHQAEIQQPQNVQASQNEFQYLCPQNRVGGSNEAGALEDVWNNGPGLILHPILSAFHAATGGIFDVFNAVTGAITGPIVDATLSALGLTKDVTQIVATVAQQALVLGGGVIGINDNTPSGQVGNDIIQGSSVLAEATSRDQGAAATTTATGALANQNDLAYQIDQEHTSFSNRYLSLSNPKSLLSTELFAFSNLRFSDLSKAVFGTFGSALASPFRVFSLPAHAAAPDGYAAANFTGIDTYDFPKQCLDTSPLDMTPQTATNAVDLGIFKPNELNWDLMTNKESWYDALYAKIGDNEDLAKKVWNCALLDNTARGGIGALYGYKGVDAFGADSNPQTPSSPTSQTTVPGDSQQVAKDILANNNITYEFSAQEDVKLTAEGKNGTNGYPIDIRTLQIVDALGQNHKVVVSAYESYGQGHTPGSDHYTGHAVDIASIDGETAYKNITDFWSEISQYSQGAIFLQGDCPGAKPAPSGMDRQPGDTCDHQHISVH